MHIEIENPGDEAYATLNQRLLAFNRDQRPQVGWRTDDVFTVVLSDEDGKVRGGGRGVVRMGAVELRGLWMDEAIRHQGWGEKIVRAVEGEGRKRGARAILLDTYEFQARAFYEKLGYTCFATFDFPDGVRRYYMTRAL